MTLKEIETRVRKIVAEQLAVQEDAITDTSNIADDLGADSLDEVELLMALEDEFEIEIPDEVAEKTKTFREIVDYVSMKVSA